MLMKLTPLLLSALALAQSSPPRFEDYPAPSDWKGPAAALKLANRWQRAFRTRLREASNESPNFAGHYRWTVWGCGSNCMSGAVVDLATGHVIAPPLAERGNAWMNFSACQSAFDGSGVDVRPDSSLMVVHCGLNYDVQLDQNVPDVYYFVLEDQGFRELAHFHGKRARGLSKGTRSDDGSKDAPKLLVFALGETQ